MDVVMLSRLQFAVTVFFHFIFVPLTLGLVVLLAIMETLYVRTGNEVYKRMVKFWGKLFLIKIKISSQIIFPVFRIFNNEETRNRTICCLCHDHKTLFFYMCPDIFLIIRYKPVRMLFIILRFMHNSHDLIHICHLCFSYPEQYLCRTILIL